MAITTKDLAQLCGVSRTTIHRALNGTGRIKPETKEMILQGGKGTRLPAGSPCHRTG